MFEIDVEIPDLQAMADEEAETLLNDITRSWADRMKVKMADSGPGGRAYRRGPNAFHVASAPGQPPAVDSGNLLGSIMPEVDGLTGKINLNLYGIFLETGTSKMAARPFAVPSLDEVMTELGF